MGEIDVESELRADNPKAAAVEVAICANALRIYSEAAANVRANGAICSHPRTGSPIENPYLKVMGQQSAVLLKCKRMKTDRVLGLLSNA